MEQNLNSDYNVSQDLHIITDGLVLALDAASPKSVPG